ncbi:hypothetical protein B0T17DRAFT_270311 [Bombardia bombarda]|uniref:Uncharacterized protein n=1 Tax=Bombardia bombarda TaxID=252184 RepID=A0AA39X1B0_9PEZI|nr:hypothetical protein B0T17DRAFT_270311 [Bombardia bombarda]
MGQHESRAVFDSLLAKTHVEHALLQPDGRHNDIPMALVTLLSIDGSPIQLQAVYESEKTGLGSWRPSPESITDEAGKTQFLGDVRFQRAYMTYFSMENGRFMGNSKALAMSHLLTGPKPLIYGLFGGLGIPMVFLGDGIELQSAILVVESLTLTAVDWTSQIHDLLTHPQLARLADELLPPEEIIGRVSYDGRLSGLMKSGPGYHEVSNIFLNQSARAAVLDYVHKLDCRDIAVVLQQLSDLSVLMLCATHKAGMPAFDFYLGHLPALVTSLRVLVETFLEEGHKMILVRGVWLLMVLAYITQLRPVVNRALVDSVELPEGGNVWLTMMSEFREERDSDLWLLRALRSLWELGKASSSDMGDSLYGKAAWKLVSEWQRWTGLGGEKEETLNIRL